jgi:hypothetical protein
VNLVGRGRTPYGEIASADLTLVSEAARTHPVTAIPLAIDDIAQRLLGHRFFTLMRLHRETMELERIYTSEPNSYPIGGRKSKRGLPWAEQVLTRGEVFIGTGPQDLKWAFDDHQKLIGLGLGSVINTPIVLGGRCLGTLNLLHESGWYRPGDERLTKVLSYLAAPAFLSAWSDEIAA